MNKINLPLLSQIVLNEETAMILSGVDNRKRSDFIREAIVEFAKERGYQAPDCKYKPLYIPSQKWQAVQTHEEKSRHVNYGYVAAYFFLKSLPTFSYMQKSEIIREAIKFKGD